MRKIKQRLIIMCVSVLIMLTGIIQPVWAADREARTIVIYKIEGSDVTMSKGTAKVYTAKEGYKLYDGYTLSTGQDSYCHLKLDENTIVKTDQSSKLAVSKASKEKLSLSVLSGSALVDAGKQAEGQVIETRVGNTGLTIRGTLFIIGHDDTGRVTITMLSGSGDVDGLPLPAGSSMVIFDDEALAEKAYEVTLVNAETMDLFTLLAVWEHQEMLQESGIITAEWLEAVPDLIQERITEMNEATPAPEIAPEIIPEIIAETPTPQATPSPKPVPEPVPVVGTESTTSAQQTNRPRRTSRPKPSETVKPIEPSEQPVEPSAPPIEPSEPPVEPSAPPIEPSEPPAEPSEPPVEPSEPPVEPSDPPVEPTDSPVDPTDPPVDPTDQPVDPTDQPVEPSEPPVEPTDSPVDPTDPPVEPSEPPVEPLTAQTPIIDRQSTDREAIVGDTITLFVDASKDANDKGKMTYQWYENTNSTNSDGAEIEGAKHTEYKFTPTVAGTYYFYVIVTNTVKGENDETAIASIASDIITVTVTEPITEPPTAQTPIINEQSIDQEIVAGDTITLFVGASKDVDDGGELTYQWYENTTAANNGGAEIEDVTDTAYEFTPTVAGTYYFYVIVTNTVVSENDETTIASVTSNVITIKVTAQPPKIVELSTHQNVSVDESVTLWVETSKAFEDGGELTFLWYKNEIPSNTGGTKIEDATEAAYTFAPKETGTYYYYVVVTNTVEEENGETATASVASDVITVKVTELIGITCKYSEAYYTAYWDVLDNVIWDSFNEAMMITVSKVVDEAINVYDYPFARYVFPKEIEKIADSYDVLFPESSAFIKYVKTHMSSASHIKILQIEDITIPFNWKDNPEKGKADGIVYAYAQFSNYPQKIPFLASSFRELMFDVIRDTFNKVKNQSLSIGSPDALYAYLSGQADFRWLNMENDSTLIERQKEAFYSIFDTLCDIYDNVFSVNEPDTLFSIGYQIGLQSCLNYREGFNAAYDSYYGWFAERKDGDELFSSLCPTLAAIDVDEVELPMPDDREEPWQGAEYISGYYLGFETAWKTYIDSLNGPMEYDWKYWFEKFFGIIDNMVYMDMMSPAGMRSKAEFAAYLAAYANSYPLVEITTQTDALMKLYEWRYTYLKNLFGNF